MAPPDRDRGRISRRGEARRVWEEGLIGGGGGGEQPASERAARGIGITRWARGGVPPGRGRGGLGCGIGLGILLSVMGL